MNNPTVAFNFDLASDLYNSAEEFPVSFDDSWSWLGYSRKDSALRSFMNFKFKENLDYSTSMWKTPQGGRSSESIYLTVDCFKTWAMMAQTDQGRLVREYFLECERIAKSKTLTPSEVLLIQVQRMVAVERRQLALEAEQKALKAQQDAIKQTQEIHSASIKQHDATIEHLEAEVHRYSNGDGEWYTILAYGRIVGEEFDKTQAQKLGKYATKLCKLQKIMPRKTRDVRYGLINTYPWSILKTLTGS